MPAPLRASSWVRPCGAAPAGAIDLVGALAIGVRTLRRRRRGRAWPGGASGQPVRRALGRASGPPPVRWVELGRPDFGVPILMYHQVMPDPHPAFRKYTLTPRVFATQMKWLSFAGYRPIDLDLLLESREAKKALPQRPVVLTFDD